MLNRCRVGMPLKEVDMRWLIESGSRANGGSVENGTRIYLFMKWFPILLSVALLSMPRTIPAVETGMLKINEIRAADENKDDAEFIELIGLTGTSITGFGIRHRNQAGTSYQAV